MKTARSQVYGSLAWGIGLALMEESVIDHRYGRWMVKDLAEALLMGRDPFRIEEIWTEMYDHSFWAKGGGSMVFAAISAIEQALWDIRGKAFGLPAYDLLRPAAPQHPQLRQYQPLHGSQVAGRFRQHGRARRGRRIRRREARAF